jgi:hypothetical protein
MTRLTFNTAEETRNHLVAAGYAKVGKNVKNIQGFLATATGERVNVGMCLHPKHRTGQSSFGFAPWIYTVMGVAH